MHIRPAGDVFAMSNKCSHLGLPLVGECMTITPMAMAHASEGITDQILSVLIVRLTASCRLLLVRLCTQHQVDIPMHLLS